MAENNVSEVTDYASIHPVITAADTANMQAGSEYSLIERAGMFTKSAAVSGIASVYNTAANLLGEEQWNVAQWLSDNDEHLGLYYQQNKQLTDLAGFIGTSLIPGGLALKGVQLAKAGTMLGPFGRALGYASTRQKLYLEQGLKELATEGGTVFNLINKNKLASMAWATADQAINVAAFETAVAITMKQSPLLEKDEWTDVFKHVAVTSLAFGGIGGAIESIAINSIFKQGTRSIDAAMREFDVVKHIEGDIVLGDKAYGTVRSLLELPTTARDIEFTYRIGGETRKLELPTKQALERAAESAQKRGWDDFRETVNRMAQSDPELGNQFSDYLINLVKREQQAGKSKEEILDRVGDHLFNVKQIRRVSANAADDPALFYVAKEIDPERIFKIKDFNSFLTEVVSRSPKGKEGFKTPYELVGTGDDVKVALVGLKQEGPVLETSYARFAVVDDAFSNGYDVAVLANGTIRINPKSSKFRKVDEPITAPKSFFNARVGAFTDVAYPTVADIATTTKPLAMTSVSHLVSGGKEWSMAPYNVFALEELDTLKASARYVWAGSKELKVVPQKVADTDIPLLERIFQDGADKWKDVVLRSADNTERKVGDIKDFGLWLKEQKLAILQSFLGKNEKGEDLLSLGVKLNVDPVWIQDAIAANFIPTEKLSSGFSLPLSASTRPQNMEVLWDFAHPKLLENSLLGKTGKVPNTVMVQGFPEAAGNTIYGELGWAYRVKLGNDARQSAFAAVMGTVDASKFVELNADTVLNIANQAGSGAGLLKSSNADYGDVLGLWSQYTGALVHEISRRNANATLSELQPLMIRIKDSKQAAAELGILTTAMRRTPEKFMIDPINNKRLVNLEAVEKAPEGGWIVNEAKLIELQKAGRAHQFVMEVDEVAEFISASSVANARRIEKNKVLMTSRGFNYNYDPRVVYIPPVDTGRYPYFAFVRKKPEMLGTSSEVSMITARTEQELHGLVTKVPDDYEVIFKENTERFHRIKGDYDYSLTIKEPTVDSTLQRRGILGDFFPETKAENVLEDYINWHQRQEVSLVRRATETKYAQTIEELRGIGKQFTELGTSKASAGLKKFRSQVENPFNDYIKTALDISKRGEYTLLHEANEFVEQLGRSAYRIFGVNREKAMAGTVSWEEANRISERFGIKGPYTDEAGSLLLIFLQNVASLKTL
jgi:hypothetical protein